MSSGRINRGAYIECDGPSCHEFVEGESFNEMWNEAKTDGWTSTKVDGKWKNFCPDCSQPLREVKIVKPPKEQTS